MNASTPAVCLGGRRPLCSLPWRQTIPAVLSWWQTTLATAIAFSRSAPLEVPSIDNSKASSSSTVKQQAINIPCARDGSTVASSALQLTDPAVSLAKRPTLRERHHQRCGRRHRPLASQRDPPCWHPRLSLSCILSRSAGSPRALRGVVPRQAQRDVMGGSISGSRRPACEAHITSAVQFSTGAAECAEATRL